MLDMGFEDEWKKLEKMDSSNEEEKAVPANNALQCPCCDYFTLEERGGYDICPVCFWEDDGLDLNRLDDHSGPNHMTLRTGRVNFQKLGACDPNMLKHVLPKPEREKYRREIRTTDI